MTRWHCSSSILDICGHRLQPCLCCVQLYLQEGYLSCHSDPRQWNLPRDVRCRFYTTRLSQLAWLPDGHEICSQSHNLFFGLQMHEWIEH